MNRVAEWSHGDHYGRTTTTLTSTVALVTGASSGIGQATARRLAARGAAVVLVARRQDRLDTLAKEIAEEGGQAVALAADLTDADAAADVVATTVERLGRLDTLVNAAGVMLTGDSVTSPLTEWQRMVDINLNGLLYLTKAALPHLVEAAATSPRQVADVVNISSIAGRWVIPTRPCTTPPSSASPPPPKLGARNTPAATSASPSSSRASWRPNSSAISKPLSTSAWRPGSPTSNSYPPTTSPKPSPTSSPAPAAGPWPKSSSGPPTRSELRVAGRAFTHALIRRCAGSPVGGVIPTKPCGDSGHTASSLAPPRPASARP